MFALFVTARNNPNVLPLGKQNAVYPYNWILLSNEKELLTGNNME